MSYEEEVRKELAEMKVETDFKVDEVMHATFTGVIVGILHGFWIGLVAGLVLGGGLVWALHP